MPRTARGGFMRTMAFLRKDLTEVFRQPRLLLTLVIGPFLILFLFGVGFVPEPPVLRTVVVAPAESGLQERIDELSAALGNQAQVVDIVTEFERAQRMLLDGTANVVIVVPPGIAETVRGGEQVTITIIHDQIDPFEASVIQLFAEGAVGELNRELQETLIAEIQEEVGIEGGLDPAVVVRPLRGETEIFGGLDVDYTHFYIPGVVSLLVQHLAVTFAVLSLVRERTLGTVELFRVSPLSGTEALIGKYLANVVLGLMVGAALTASAVAFFGFQSRGPWWWYGLAVLIVVLASVGLGFLLAAAAQNESQAVQYAMITLLVSIFFSGFFIATERLVPAVQLVSYLVPATYGISALQDIVFWGRMPSVGLIAGSLAYAMVLGSLALVFMRRRVRAARAPGQRHRSAPATA